LYAGRVSREDEEGARPFLDDQILYSS